MKNTFNRDVALGQQLAKPISNVFKILHPARFPAKNINLNIMCGCMLQLRNTRKIIKISHIFSLKNDISLLNAVPPLPWL